VSVAVLVPAAGRGERLGGGRPKAFQPLRGEPLVVHALRALQGCADVVRLVVAAPPDATAEMEHVLAAAGLRPGWSVVPGAEYRQTSVAAALATLDTADDVVLVHDAARCLVPVEVIQRVVDALRAGAEAVVPAVPIPDTIKQVQGDRVVATVDRSSLRAVQTPQGFRRDVLERACAHPGQVATDDAGLAEQIGATVRVVAGHPEAFKVTGPLDLVLAEAVLAAR
jgi:2-C-methyl-D-erythritol 4-phosphate cytidylyltransferase